VPVIENTKDYGFKLCTSVDSAIVSLETEWRLINLDLLGRRAVAFLLFGQARLDLSADVID
jgi:hypothetical protein